MAKETKSPNPFLDDDDVDDNEFLNSGYNLGRSGIQSEWEDKRRQLLEERRRIEERTLQSTDKSLGLLHESEQVGIFTAEELVHQREQLQNIDSNLDFINSTMKTSQKHLNSMKSIFGGIKNYFSKGEQPKAPTPVISEGPTSAREGHLENTIDRLKSDASFARGTHPALRNRDLSYEETDSFGRELPRQKATSPSASNSSQVFEEKLDKNLEFMSLGLGRLKNLAIDLNEEIEQQNEMIGNIHEKADKADETLQYQNRQIKRILKK